LQFPEDVEGSLFASHHGFENSGGDRAMHPAAAIGPTCGGGFGTRQPGYGLFS
jgi:hypothetical protein